MELHEQDFPHIFYFTWCQKITQSFKNCNIIIIINSMNKKACKWGYILYLKTATSVHPAWLWENNSVIAASGYLCDLLIYRQFYRSWSEKSKKNLDDGP